MSVPSDPAQRTERTVRRLAMVEYKVVELRERMWGGAQAGQELEKVLNKHAREGWQLKAITRADVKGRVGRGAVEGLIITMERQK